MIETEKCEEIYTIIPSALDIDALYDFLIHKCDYFKVTMLTLMLSESKELIDELRKRGKQCIK